MLTKTLVAATLGLATFAVSASQLFVSYDNFNYAGTVTRYATLADAQNGTNAIASAAIATVTNGPRSTLENARDAQIFAASNAPGYYSDIAYASTAWYYSDTPANGYGWGNPNNTNTGFMQFYDLSGVPSVTGGWSDGNTTFTVNISGGNGDSSNAARLWAPPVVGGASSITGGVFRAFSLSMSASFGSAAVLNGSTGWHETDNDPLTLTGTAQGIFENQGSDASLHGFYAFLFTLAPGSWADQAGATADGFGPSAFFAAPGARVPEPGTLMLLAVSLAALALQRRRR